VKVTKNLYDHSLPSSTMTYSDILFLLAATPPSLWKPTSCALPLGDFFKGTLQQNFQPQEGVVYTKLNERGKTFALTSFERRLGQTFRYRKTSTIYFITKFLV